VTVNGYFGSTFTVTYDSTTSGSVSTWTGSVEAGSTIAIVGFFSSTLNAPSGATCEFVGESWPATLNCTIDGPDTATINVATFE
jgi:hypothetical protein